MSPYRSLWLPLVLIVTATAMAVLWLGPDQPDEAPPAQRDWPTVTTSTTSTTSTTTSTTTTVVATFAESASTSRPSSGPAAVDATPQPDPHADEPGSLTPSAEQPGMSAQTALASWYSTGEMGNVTASGIPLDDSVATFAHKTMAFGTTVRFCHNGQCITATCTDRGPYAGGRTFDLSQAAFAAIAPLSAGEITVTWEVV